MVHFLPVYGSRLRAHVDLQGADNRLDGERYRAPGPPSFQRTRDTKSKSRTSCYTRRAPRKNKRLRYLTRIAAYNAIEANPTYVGNGTPPFAAAQNFVEIERTRPGMSLLATDQRSEADSTVNDRSIHQVIKTPPDCLDHALQHHERRQGARIYPDRVMQEAAR